MCLNSIFMRVIIYYLYSINHTILTFVLFCRMVGSFCVDSIDKVWSISIKITTSESSENTYQHCSICDEPATVINFPIQEKRSYLYCQVCNFRFLSVDARLSKEAEEVYYRLHENDIHDLGYQNYVRPLYEKILELVVPSGSGLDFGCGPGPVLAHMLGKKGYSITLYDPLFNPDSRALEKPYDFIVCSEVAEHFKNPIYEFSRLYSMLNQDGYLAVMTSLYRPGIDFSKWHYRRDPTHVSFYSLDTIISLANKVGFSSVWSDKVKVMILKKQ